MHPDPPIRPARYNPYGVQIALITLKIPGSVVRDLRSYSEASGKTLGEIVARAISRFLKATRRHG